MFWFLLASFTAPSHHLSSQSRFELRDGKWVRLELILCVFPRDFRGEPFSDVIERPNPLLPLIRVRSNFDDELRESADQL